MSPTLARKFFDDVKENPIALGCQGNLLPEQFIVKIVKMISRIARRQTADLTISQHPPTVVLVAV
jgi:signal recognition particle GTPase